MNYIELINNFWQKDIEYAFSDREITLYFYLLKISNSLGWKNPFGLSNAMTAAKFHWGKKSYNTAKLKLQKAGLIDFTICSGRGKTYRYEIKGVQPDHFSEPFLGTFSDTFSDQKGETSLNININKTKKKNNNNEKRIAFVVPSVNEIADYCTQRANDVDALQFFDYYQSKGWSVGKGEMKDWRAAVRIWERNIKNNTNNGQKINCSNRKNNEAARRKAQIVDRAIRAVADCDSHP